MKGEIEVATLAAPQSTNTVGVWLQIEGEQDLSFIGNHSTDNLEKVVHSLAEWGIEGRQYSISGEYVIDDEEGSVFFLATAHPCSPEE